jgi:hypothetical protein
MSEAVGLFISAFACNQPIWGELLDHSLKGVRAGTARATPAMSCRNRRWPGNGCVGTTLILARRCEAFLIRRPAGARGSIQV